MKSIWVIEQGSYSDYGVTGVYSTKEAAQLVADKINASSPYEEATIAEWPLNPGVDEIKAGLGTWNILMLKDGSTELCEKEGFSAYYLTSCCAVWPRSTAPAYQGKGVPDVLHCHIRAKDMKHALKIANEFRIAKLASGEFK